MADLKKISNLSSSDSKNEIYELPCLQMKWSCRPHAAKRYPPRPAARNTWKPPALVSSSGSFAFLCSCYVPIAIEFTLGPYYNMCKLMEHTVVLSAVTAFLQRYPIAYIYVTWITMPPKIRYLISHKLELRRHWVSFSPVWSHSFLIKWVMKTITMQSH